MTENQAYARAGRIIDVAMGQTVLGAGRGRKRKIIRNADQDPLAYWCGVEAIMDLCRACLAASTNENGASHG